MIGSTHVSHLGVLAEPNSELQPLDLAGWTAAALHGMLERMLLIRAAEIAIARMVETGEARCPCHLAIGQEACAVGVAAAYDVTRDRAFGAHRSHGHYLALGADLDELMAEVLGKVSGCSGGMGGSMHLVSPQHGLLGTVPIVGATIPLAVGAGLALQLDDTGGVAVSFFGDGATEEGVFHESVNLAATMKLPVLFACENNLFSSHLHIALRQPADSIARYGVAHCINSERVDGNDVVAVAAAARRLTEASRGGAGPGLLEMVTYRWKGHVGHRDDDDVGVKRGGELPLWKARDPIRRLASAMQSAGHLENGTLGEIELRVQSVVDTAIERARQASYPDPEATIAYVYSPGVA